VYSFICGQNGLLCARDVPSFGQFELTYGQVVVSPSVEKVLTRFLGLSVECGAVLADEHGETQAS